MSSSRHKITFEQPLRDVRVQSGLEALVSEGRMREQLAAEFQSGFEAGQKALREQLVEQRLQLHELQHGVLRTLQDALPTVIAECEKSVVLLALESARRVMQQIPVDANFVEQTVKSALKELKDTAEFEVLLHPSDLEILHQIQSGLLPSPEDTRVRFLAEVRVARGDCIVNTKHGSIAVARERMMQRMEEAILC